MVTVRISTDNVMRKGERIEEIQLEGESLGQRRVFTINLLSRRPVTFAPGHASRLFPNDSVRPSESH